MKTYCHAPQVPEALQPLLDLAYNLWWTSDPQARQLFESLSPGLWRQLNHNPIRLLRIMKGSELETLAEDRELTEHAWSIRNRMVAALERDSGFRHVPTGIGVAPLEIEREPIAAYFCSEFGLHESLPIYSGGLGILAGDHVRSTSDLGLPFVGIGLLYRLGYFHQRFSLDNWQLEEFEALGFHDLPLKMVIDDDGAPVMVTLNLPGRQLKARAWVCQVGRSSLFLLDCYLRENWVEDREVTAKLYDSDREVRLKQEILLGVGGVRLLEALHVTPRRFHMNEGHSAFMVLERTANIMEKKSIGFAEAKEITRNANVFTTHTPVAAGHEVFRRELMEPYFLPQLENLGLSAERVLRAGTPQGKRFERPRSR